MATPAGGLGIEAEIWAEEGDFQLAALREPPATSPVLCPFTILSW